MVQPIYLYDKKNGRLIKPYPSKSALERELDLYRGACSDLLKNPNRIGKVLVSTEKYEAHPLFNVSDTLTDLTKEEHTREDITVKEEYLSESDLRKKHDMFYIVLLFVKNISDGKYIEENMMLRQLGLVGKPRVREVLCRPDLKEFRGRVDSVNYYGSANSIKKLKQEGVLQ